MLQTMGMNLWNIFGLEKNDIVNHYILSDNFYMCVVSVSNLEWFSSYLSNRYQYVVYNNCKSDSKLIKYGVPLGSILGPLLFLFFTNDLPVSIFMPIVFTDDTNISHW